MHKHEYFLKAVASEAFKYKIWILSVFAVIKSHGKQYDFPYMIVNNPDDPKKVYFKTPEGGLEVIDGVSKDSPIFDLLEIVEAQPGDVPNLKASVTTMYGNLLYNAMVLSYAFRDVIPYQNGLLNPKKIEETIALLLQDEPETPELKEPSKIYVSDYLRYAEAVSALSVINTFAVNAGTPKTMRINPEIIKRRDELFKEHEHELDDPAIIAKIEAELTSMDKADFKNDRANKFYTSSKVYDVARKRAFIMVGVEQNFGGSGGKVHAIKRPLREGWDMENFPYMVDSLRAGSYFRGNQTALGGQQVKDIFRVLQNSTVSMDDCGTTDGLEWEITEDYKRLIGMFETGKPPIELTDEYLKTKVGSKILLRSPTVCKAEGGSFCAKCVGTMYSSSPEGLPSAGSGISSRLLNMFMKRMHGVALRTARYEINNSIT